MGEIFQGPPGQEEQAGSKLRIVKAGEQREALPDDERLKGWIRSHHINDGLAGGMDDDYADETLGKQIPPLRRVEKLSDGEIEEEAREYLEKYLNDVTQTVLLDVLQPAEVAQEAQRLFALGKKTEGHKLLVDALGRGASNSYVWPDWDKSVDILDGLLSEAIDDHDEKSATEILEQLRMKTMSQRDLRWREQLFTSFFKKEPPDSPHAAFVPEEPESERRPKLKLAEHVAVVDRAKELLQSNQADEAKQVLAEALEETPRSETLLTGQYDLALDTGDNTLAREVLAKLRGVQDTETFRQAALRFIDRFNESPLATFNSGRHMSARDTSAITKKVDGQDSLYVKLLTYFGEVDDEILRLRKENPHLKSLLDDNQAPWHIENMLTGTMDWAEWPARKMFLERMGSDHKAFITTSLTNLKAKLVLSQHKYPDADAVRNAKDGFLLKVIKELKRDWNHTDDKLIEQTKLGLSPGVWKAHEEAEREYMREHLDWDENDSTGEEEGAPKEAGVPYEQFIGQMRFDENIEKGMDEGFAARLAAKQGEAALEGTMTNINQMFDDAAGLAKEIRGLPYPVGHISDIAVGAENGKPPILNEIE